MSSNYKNTAKTVTADLTTNYDAEMATSLAEKIRNVSKDSEHNFEGWANSEFDKDTDRSIMDNLSLLFSYEPILIG